MLEGYPVLCTTSGCHAAARYKIAAGWSDGVKRELKTYALSCPACLPRDYATAVVKHAASVLAAGETLLPPAVYERGHGSPAQLTRRAELEKEPGAGPS
jgi:hypothetical protein